MPRKLNLLGKTFGRLTVIGPAENDEKGEKSAIVPQIR